MIKAIYCGTFDPPTTGHMDIIKRSFKFCDELIVAVGVNSSKKSMFNEQERVSLLAMTLGEFLPADKHPKVSIKTFEGLLANFAKEQGASVLIRGIRSVSDFEYEINLAGINRTLDKELETVFLPTSSELAVVSSSMVKEIAKCGGDIKPFVAKGVAEEITKKFGFLKTGDEDKEKHHYFNRHKRHRNHVI